MKTKDKTTTTKPAAAAQPTPPPAAPTAAPKPLSAAEAAAACKCVNKERKPINAAPMWHGASCPVLLEAREQGIA